MENVYRANAGGLLNGGPPDLYERFVANEWDIDKTLRAYTPLFRDEQIKFDTTVVDIFESRLRVARRLVDLGLVTQIDNPFRVSELQYSKGDSTIGSGVRRSMSPIPRADNEKPEYILEKIPIYFTLAMFMLDLRELETSRNLGTPLDVSIAARKVRAIVDDIEDAIINGGTPQISGNQAKGFLDAPDLNTLEVPMAWSDPTMQGTDFLRDLEDALGLAEDQKAFGPFDLVLTPKWYNALRNDYNTTYPRTIANRLAEIQAGGEAVFIYTSDKMPEDTAILYPRDPSNVRLVMANMGGSPATQVNSDRIPTFTPISLFPWETVGGFVKNWLVATVVIPNMRSTSEQQSGIVKIVPEVS